MTDKDTSEMIQRCIEEINSLRNQVAALRPLAAAYESIQQILNLMPKTSQGYGEDLVWRLKKQLDELKPKVGVATSDASA